jgi:FAD/FMN-containing dehydrogenase
MLTLDTPPMPTAMMPAPGEEAVMGIAFRTLDASMKVIEPATIEALQATIRGEVLTADSPHYDEARTIWNAAVNRKPALIVRCREAGDAVRSIRFARDNHLLVAVRGGGHHIAGNAICDQGIVIDLSGMKAVRVDPKARRAWVEPGATLADLDRETQPFGLAVPTGINSTTGIAGLTLKGAASAGLPASSA